MTTYLPTIKQLQYLPYLLSSRVVVPDREDMRYLILNCMPPDKQDALLRAP